MQLLLSTVHQRPTVNHLLASAASRTNSHEVGWSARPIIDQCQWYLLHFNSLKLLFPILVFCKIIRPTWTCVVCMGSQHKLNKNASPHTIDEVYAFIAGEWVTTWGRGINQHQLLFWGQCHKSWRRSTVKERAEKNDFSPVAGAPSYTHFHAENDNIAPGKSVFNFVLIIFVTTRPRSGTATTQQRGCRRSTRFTATITQKSLKRIKWRGKKWRKIEERDEDYNLISLASSPSFLWQSVAAAAAPHVDRAELSQRPRAE